MLLRAVRRAQHRHQLTQCRVVLSLSIHRALLSGRDLVLLRRAAQHLHPRLARGVQVRLDVLRVLGVQAQILHVLRRAQQDWLIFSTLTESRRRSGGGSSRDCWDIGRGSRCLCSLTVSFRLARCWTGLTPCFLNANLHHHQKSALHFVSVKHRPQRTVCDAVS
jgi:hypothetical protein